MSAPLRKRCGAPPGNLTRIFQWPAHISVKQPSKSTASPGIKNGNLGDLVQNAQSFARRQPTAFLGIAVLAGFGVVRFLKSSAESSSTSGTSASMPRRATSSQGYRDDFTN
jgi:hypothetical protein